MLPRVETGIVGTLATDALWGSLARDSKDIARDLSYTLGYRHLKSPLKEFLCTANGIPRLEAVAITAWHTPEHSTALSIYALADFMVGRIPRVAITLFNDRIAAAYSTLDQRARAGSPQLAVNLLLRSTRGTLLVDTVECIREELREFARETDTPPASIPFVLALPTV